LRRKNKKTLKEVLIYHKLKAREAKIAENED
jgi:hypothetical protein